MHTRTCSWCEDDIVGQLPEFWGGEAWHAGCLNEYVEGDSYNGLATICVSCHQYIDENEGAMWISGDIYHKNCFYDSGAIG